jgi:LmbE family N-acetylglucosaminyl deacetylase
LRITRPEDLGPYDCLYVAPATSHALFSCSARIAREVASGRRVLVACLFEAAADGPAPPSAAALGRIGVDVYEAGLPPARDRSALYRSSVGRVFGRDTGDDACVDRAAQLLTEVSRRTRARHVCIPLAVGGHIDHRLAHEAGLRGFEAQAERDVMLYEDRPAAFVPGAVRIRLAQLGARLPPAAQPASRSGLLRFLVRLHAEPELRRQMGGLGERLRFTGKAAREWRAARGWDPRRSLGLRVQPVLEEGEGFEPALRELLGDGGYAGYQRRAALYAKGLGPGTVERYWLRLPSREEDALASPSSG